MTTRTKTVELIGFAPDVDPTMPGAMLDAKYLIPTRRGFMAQPRWTKSKTNTSGPVGLLRSFLSERSVNTIHEYVFVADTGSTATWMYGRDLFGGATDWTNLSETAGFTGIASYGNVVVTRFGNYQVMSVSSGALRQRYSPLNEGLASGNKVRAISGAPSSANALVTANRFVLAFGATHTGATASADGWYCSARDDHTSWTISPTTLCAYGRLVETDGEIRAGIEFYNDVIAFKRDAMYRGRFDRNSSEIWVWEKLPFSVGCVGPNAVCKIDDMVAFVHTSGVFLFDGAQLISLTPNFTDWLSQASTAMVSEGDLGYTDLYRRLFTQRYVFLRYDHTHELLFLTYPSGSLRAGYGMVCHVPTKRWTKIRFGGTSISNGHMLADPNSGEVIQVMSSAGYESTIGGTSNMYYMVFGNSNGANTYYDGTLSAFNAATSTGGAIETHPTFTLNDFGDDFADSELVEARIRFVTAPSASNCVPMYRNTLNATLTTASTATLSSDGKFDLRQNARWHRLLFTFSDDTSRAEFTSLRLTFAGSSERGEG